MGYAIARTVELTDMECGECGIVFAVPEWWRAKRQETGDTWYCPNGHPRVYRETDKVRLQRLLNEANARNTQLTERVRAAQEAENRAVKETKRLKRRISAGVCPCCKRTFENLARHMKSKHPENVNER